MMTNTTRPPEGLILSLEASTAAGSVALLRYSGEQSASPWLVLAERQVAMGSGRSDRLTSAIEALLNGAGVTVAGLAAIVCGNGPGSFTSLRIVASIAKGLAFERSLPVYAVSSLLLAIEDVPPVAPSTRQTGEWLYVSDALRDERYVQPIAIHADGYASAIGEPGRVTVAGLDAMAAGRPLRFVDGGAKGLAPRAVNVRRLADWAAFGPVPLDQWEPAYGRLAEAQVKWEAAHGHSLPDG